MSRAWLWVFAVLLVLAVGSNVFYVLAYTRWAVELHAVELGTARMHGYIEAVAAVCQAGWSR